MAGFILATKQNKSLFIFTHTPSPKSASTVLPVKALVENHPFSKTLIPLAGIAVPESQTNILQRFDLHFLPGDFQ
jgi:hypothetical protein